jgi:hypothetical protein
MGVKLGFLLEEYIVDWEERADLNAQTLKKLSNTVLQKIHNEEPHILYSLLKLF